MSNSVSNLCFSIVSVNNLYVRALKLVTVRRVDPRALTAVDLLKLVGLLIEDLHETAVLAVDLHELVGLLIEDLLEIYRACYGFAQTCRSSRRRLA